jgi:hypothetical protein
MSIATPSLENLQRAVAIAEQIKKLENELASIFGDKASPKVSVKAPAQKVRRAKRSLSPEARERIAAAQRARWAKTKGSAAPAAAAVEKPAAKSKGKRKKAKRNISPEAREKMAAAAKRRWAKVKAKA